MKKIPFVKMAGAGNDFIIMEGGGGLDYADLAKKACHRQMGIGADGVLILDKSKSSDFRMRIINADGSEAEMCGNGARCMAAYVADKHVSANRLFSMETLAGQILAEANGATARVRLSDPKDYRAGIVLKVGGQVLHASYIDTGVPHAVVFVDGLSEVDVDSLGRLVRNHNAFKPRGANVNFVEQNRKDMVTVRTYERGVEGETLACGTGAVAGALVGYLHLNPKVKEVNDAFMRVLTKSGEILEVTFDLQDGNRITDVWLKGSANVIAKGEYFFN